MLKFRAISFPILLGLFFAMCYWEEGGIWIFALLSGLMVFGLSWDLSSMFAKIGKPNYRLLNSIISLSFIIFLFLSQNVLFFLVIVITLLATTFVFSKNPELNFKRYINSIAILVITGTIALPLIIIYREDVAYFIFLVLVTKAMDTGGYIFGVSTAKLMPNGNHKIFPKISPKKSWEGTIGGLIFSVGVALIFYKLGVVKYSISWCIVAGVLFGIGSLLGDLTESAVKRICGVKDSGNYIPGMGGAFDVVDSFIYNGVLFPCVMLLSSIL